MVVDHLHAEVRVEVLLVFYVEEDEDAEDYD